MATRTNSKDEKRSDTGRIAKGASRSEDSDKRSLPERVESITELGLKGSFSDIETLLDVALGDRSSGMRLAAAAAAAEILFRYRLPSARRALPAELPEALFRRLRGLDPGLNTGLSQVVGSLGHPDSLTQLLRTLQDPRADVRVGAIVGLERLLVSGASNGVPQIEESLVRLLESTSQRPEISLELARVASRVGSRRSRPAIAALGERLPPKWTPQVDALLSRLDSLCQPDDLHDVWFTQGTDAGSAVEGKVPREWFYPGAEVAVSGPEGAFTTSSVRWSSENVELVWHKEPVELPYRRLLARYGGNEPAELLQIGDRTWIRADEKDFLRFVCLLSAQLPFDAAKHQGLLEPLLLRCSKRTSGLFARALLDLWVGSVCSAVPELEALQEAGKTLPELWYFLGLAYDRQGDRDKATASFQGYLKRAGKKGLFLTQARRLSETGP